MKRPPPLPPTPPLGDASIDRIERGVFSALDARAVQPDAPRASRRRFVAFAMAGAAAMGAIFGVREWRRAEVPPSSAAQISTTDSGSHIAISGAVLDVAPHSAVSFGGRHGATVVVLNRGTVTCEVAPRSKGAPFVVEAGATRVTVIGTKFSVHRVGDHATVTVDHGLVEVADTDLTELVHAGERYTPGGAITREPLASQAPAEPVAASSAQAAAPPAPIVAAPLAAAAPTATQPPLARQPRARKMARVAAVAEEGASAAPVADPAEAAPAPTVEAPAQADAPSGEAPSAQRRGSVQVLFELAAQLEVRDPAAALRIYGELSAAEDGWAASALFASARLEAERGQGPRARALCETYLRRFPRGPNADDARTLLATLR